MLPFSVLKNKIYDDWSFKKYDMTYILAGNYNGIGFLISDCIATNPEGQLTFSYKTYKFCSSDTCMALSGDAIISNTFILHDNLAFFENRTTNYEDEDTVRQIIGNMIRENPDKNFGPWSRLFFLKKDSIFYYEVRIDIQKRLTLQKYYIKPNSYVICHSDIFPINENIENLIFFSIDTIIEYNIEIANVNNDAILDFKNRFSYVQSDDMFLHVPYLNLNEYMSFNMYSIPWNNVEEYPQ